jgi:hypothetical protein
MSCTVPERPLQRLQHFAETFIANKVMYRWIICTIDRQISTYIQDKYKYCTIYIKLNILVRQLLIIPQHFFAKNRLISFVVQQALFYSTLKQHPGERVSRAVEQQPSTSIPNQH